MRSIPDIIKEKLSTHPFLYELLSRDLANYSRLAEYLQDEISLQFGSKVSQAAIMMALRRIAHNLNERKTSPRTAFNAEVILKSGLCDVTILKTPALLTKLKRLYGLVDQSRGETLNIIHGNYEVTIVMTEKYLSELKKLLEVEEIVNIEKNLVSLATSFSKDFLYTPGMLALATRELAWENINVYENISTMTELIFIVSSNDATRAYDVLKRLTEAE